MLAYVARYAHVPPSESRHYDSAWLRRFCEKLNEIVKEENGDATPPVR